MKVTPFVTVLVRGEKKVAQLQLKNIETRTITTLHVPLPLLRCNLGNSHCICNDRLKINYLTVDITIID